MQRYSDMYSIHCQKQIDLYTTPYYFYTNPYYIYTTPYYLYTTPYYLYTTPYYPYTTPYYLYTTPYYPYTTPSTSPRPLLPLHNPLLQTVCSASPHFKDNVNVSVAPEKK